MKTTVTVINIIPNSLSGETWQDSEPHLSVNPANPLQIGATAFTLNPGPGPFAPVYKSFDGGNTWRLDPIVPIPFGLPVTNDITTSFASDGKNFYSGIMGRFIDPTEEARPRYPYLQFLRTDAFMTPTPMTVLAARPHGDQPFTLAMTVPTGPDAGQDRVYIGDNDHNAGAASATLDASMNGKLPPPNFDPPIRLESRSTWSSDGPQMRPAVHPDGTVYVAFYGWRSGSGNPNTDVLTITSADLVLLRDDNWGKGPSPFTALIDPDDSKVGLRVVQGIGYTLSQSGTAPAVAGQQRLSGSIAVAVDPTNSSTVWIAWGDRQPESLLTLHVRRSLDRGKTWSPDLLTVPQATNAALAITQNGVVGLLCQRFGNGSQWVTTLNFTVNGTQWSQMVLAQTPASIPVKQFNPYLGDYDHMVAVDNSFYGVFCANNTPDLDNFPQGPPTYLRNANFVAKTLLDLDGKTPVAISIDPFFFKVTPDPCQPLSDAVDALNQKIQNLQDALATGEIPEPAHTPTEIAEIQAFIAKLQAQLNRLEQKLVQCRQQNP